MLAPIPDARSTYANVLKKWGGDILSLNHRKCFPYIKLVVFTSLKRIKNICR